MISPVVRHCRGLVDQLGLICAVTGFMVLAPAMGVAQSDADLQQALKHLEGEQYQQAQPLLERLAGKGMQLPPTTWVSWLNLAWASPLTMSGRPPCTTG